MQMFIYHLTRTDHIRMYDDHTSGGVVIAESVEAAKDLFLNESWGWAREPFIQVATLGKSKEKTPRVVCASTVTY